MSSSQSSIPSSSSLSVISMASRRARIIAMLNPMPAGPAASCLRGPGASVSTLRSVVP
eukprot:CAMPEP_0119122544 /NCGR_PEP_ID=MMETSP1310-20130426/2776_1 /TAXON_ID=464262 /ORGANISM="Genus nov. species nov., Strain RCC2339" /LENGTH=57 /DNA_ID=CAMNT_0007112219 /DNA_START=12 /DNA_END=182 /DNA_ORIENTATION=-